MISRCLHNNLDPECIRILKAVVPGLVHGGPNARLLICEKLLPAWDPSRVRNKTKMLLREDIIMMISSGGKKRSLKDFEALIKAADERFEVCRSLFVIQCRMLSQTPRSRSTGCTTGGTIPLFCRSSLFNMILDQLKSQTHPSTMHCMEVLTAIQQMSRATTPTSLKSSRTHRLTSWLRKGSMLLEGYRLRERW